MQTKRLGSAVALLLALSAEALAGPGECASILHAFSALTEVPAYRQQVSNPGGQDGTLVVIGNSLYLKGAQTWKTKELHRSRRLQYLLPGFSEAALEGCETSGTRSHEARLARHYRFVLAGEKAQTVEVLVGLDDGLIRRIERSEGRIDLQFESVMPPVP